MPMKPFEMSETSREMVSRYIEEYHLTEERGQFSFMFRGNKYTLQNFASMHSPMERALTYTILREALQTIFIKLNESVEMNSPEMWSEWFEQIPAPYTIFLNFALSGEHQSMPLLNELADYMEKIKNENDYAPKLIQILLDIVGIVDHAVAYGSYLITEFTNFLDKKEYDELIANQEKFPVHMKKCNSKEEAQEFLNQLKEKEQEPESEEEKLKSMTPASWSIN